MKSLVVLLLLGLFSDSLSVPMSQRVEEAANTEPVEMSQLVEEAANTEPVENESPPLGDPLALTSGTPAMYILYPVQQQGLSNQQQGFSNQQQQSYCYCTVPVPLNNQQQGLSNQQQGFSNQQQGFSNQQQGFSNQRQGLNNQQWQGFSNQPQQGLSNQQPSYCYCPVPVAQPASNPYMFLTYSSTQSRGMSSPAYQPQTQYTMYTLTPRY